MEPDLLREQTPLLDSHNLSYYGKALNLNLEEGNDWMEPYLLAGLGLGT